MLTESDLYQFSGTEHWYRHMTGVLYTDGIKYMAEHGAYWLIDEIAFAQRDRKITRNPRLQDFQLWELTKQGNSAVLTCKEDSGMEPAYKKEIPFTDFPLQHIKVYVERGSVDGEVISMIMMLPSER